MAGATRRMGRMDTLALDDADMVRMVVSELRRLAVNGLAPTVQQYSIERDPGTPSHTAVIRRTGLSWTALARKAGLTRNNGRTRGMHDLFRVLPGYIAEEIKHECLCECGEHAIAIGWFVNLTGSDSTVSNAMLLCAKCAEGVDGNVRVELLGKNQPRSGNQG